MWLRYSKSLLFSTKNSKSIYFKIIEEFRREISRNSIKIKSRQSIKNFDQSKIIHVKTPNEIRPISLLIRPTIFTISVIFLFIFIILFIF